MSDDKKSKTPKDTHYAKLRRAYRDQKAGGAAARSGRASRSPPGETAPDGLVRLYGLHTVRAALDNPRRKIKKHAGDPQRAERLAIADLAALPFKAEWSSRRTSTRSPAREAVHQGV